MRFVQAAGPSRTVPYGTIPYGTVRYGTVPVAETTRTAMLRSAALWGFPLSCHGYVEAVQLNLRLRHILYMQQILAKLELRDEEFLCMYVFVLVSV